MIGYPWSQDIAVTVPAGTAALFPSGATFRSHFKAHPSNASPLAEATVTRLSDTSIRLALTAAQTAALAEGYAHFDVARTDLSPDAHTYLRGRVEVAQPVTRQGEPA